MKTKKKILVISGTIILVLAILFGVYMLFVRNDKDDDRDDSTDMSTEEIDVFEYFERRTDTFAEETYAILIWRPEEEWGRRFLEEIEKAFEGKNIKIFTLSLEGLEDYHVVRVEEDVKELMSLTEPMIVPTLIVMRNGESVLQQGGLIFSSELIERLEELGIK